MNYFYKREKKMKYKFVHRKWVPSIVTYSKHKENHSWYASSVRSLMCVFNSKRTRDCGCAQGDNLNHEYCMCHYCHVHVAQLNSRYYLHLLGNSMHQIDLEDKLYFQIHKGVTSITCSMCALPWRIHVNFSVVPTPH